MKTLNTFSSVAATLLATAIALSATVSLTACGKDNTAGTDEQQNSITAKLDSALTIWLASDTLIVTEQHSTPCTDCPFDIPHLYPSDMTTYPKIQVENGALYNPKHDDFKSIVCENDSNWFSYSVFAPTSRSSQASVSSISIMPAPMPMTLWKPNLCLNEAAKFSVKVEPSTLLIVFDDPVFHSVNELVPGGSRNTMLTFSGPAVTKLLPVGRRA